MSEQVKPVGTRGTLWLAACVYAICSLVVFESFRALLPDMAVLRATLSTATNLVILLGLLKYVARNRYLATK